MHRRILLQRGGSPPRSGYGVRVSGWISDGLRTALAAAYGLSDAELDRVANGQSTLNYAGTAGGRRIFVKCYSTDANLHAERHAIKLCEYAGPLCQDQMRQDLILKP